MQQIQLNREEAILRGAQDGSFFCHFFCPKSFNLEPAEFHGEVWDILSNPLHRYICLEVFRDGAKTTLLRGFTLRGIAYGIYRTIVFLSESRSHAKRSLKWLRNRITRERNLRESFSLSIGDIDNAEELEIVNGAYGTRTRIIAQGIFGQVRGINEDDERPDLIICDDIASLENAGSPEMLEKVNEIFFGAIANSLCAPSQNPHSKLVNLGTRIGENDTIGKCQVDSQWICKSFSIFTEEGESIWPSKWSTNQLRKDKSSAIERNQLSTWMREKECKLVRSESTAFNAEWLNFYVVVPVQRTYFMGVDPLPPPSEREINSGFKKKDFEVFSIVALSNGQYYLEEQLFNRGHEIDWTLDTFFYLLQQYRPRAAGVEAIAYQRTLSSLFRQEMLKRRAFLTQIIPLADKRKKFHRISDELGPIAVNRCLHVRKNHELFIQQFIEYPGCIHDDHLESVVFAVMAAKECYGYAITDDTQDDFQPYSIEKESHIPDLPRHNVCP